MKIQLSNLTTERKWRAVTSFDKQRFEKLLEIFNEFYVKIYGKPVQERQVKTEIAYCSNSAEKLLFLTLTSIPNTEVLSAWGLADRRWA